MEKLVIFFDGKLKLIDCAASNNQFALEKPQNENKKNIPINFAGDRKAVCVVCKPELEGENINTDETKTCTDCFNSSRKEERIIFKEI